MWSLSEQNYLFSSGRFKKLVFLAFYEINLEESTSKFSRKRQIIEGTLSF